LLTYLNSFSFTTYYDSVLSAVYFNIYCYIFLICQIFLIIFMFDTTYFRTINELKFISDLKKIVSPTLNTFLSMAGIPPFLGFCSKFVIFIVIFEKINLLFIVLYSFFNLFVIFFYIQNFRFLSSNKSYSGFFNLPLFSKKKFFFNVLSLFQFINFFSIFYFGDILCFLNGLSIFSNF